MEAPLGNQRRFFYAASPLGVEALPWSNLSCRRRAGAFPHQCDGRIEGLWRPRAQNLKPGHNGVGQVRAAGASPLNVCLPKAVTGRYGRESTVTR